MSTSAQKTSFPGFILNNIARWACEESAAIASEESPFSGSLIKGDPRLLLIVGENASGKSLLFRMICGVAHKEHDILPITISIRERTGSGTDGMERMRRAFMFGNEIESSTGAISSRVVDAGFNNIQREVPSILALDEPEIGLSDGYAEALGELIGQRTNDLADNCCGVMVVTHNRRLVRGLMRGLGATPSFVSMSKEVQTVEQWLAQDESKSVQDLLCLRDVALDRFRTINRILKD